MSANPAFHRLELLTGPDVLTELAKTRVIVFGIGGVGSWCAEALTRSGIGHLAIVDSDAVCVTNINRQIQATHETVGRLKTDVMRDRLVSINPRATIETFAQIFSVRNSESFDLSAYGYVIDAIDSLSSKVELVRKASAAGARVFSALGASNKIDITKIRTGSLWESKGCHFGRYVRKKLRQRGFHGEVTCVYSDEQREPFDVQTPCGSGACMCPKAVIGDEDQTGSAHEWCSTKKQINGSAVHVTGTFGFILAGLVIQDVVKRHEELQRSYLAPPCAKAVE